MIPPTFRALKSAKKVAKYRNFHRLKFILPENKRVTGRKNEFFSLFHEGAPPRCLQSLAALRRFFERNMQRTHGARAWGSYGIEGGRLEVESPMN